MATTVYKRTALTGGGANALDGIDGNDLLDADFSFSMVNGVLYIHELDDDSGLTESSPGVIAPDTNAGNKRWIQRRLASDNATPEGVIVGFIGGYFSNSSNGTYVDVLGNTASAVNTLLNSDGWYVCDGSELNLATSTIYNGAGRYLPNLTDSRFLMGYSAAGSTGGNNTQSHTHTTADHTLTVDEMPSHGHYGQFHKGGTEYMVDAGSYYGGGRYGIQNGSVSNRGGGLAHNHGSTDAASVDNRPQYLTTIYIIKVY